MTLERVTPREIRARIGREEPQRARVIQLANGELYQPAFARGLAVTGFERGDTQGTYLLEAWQ